MYVVSSDNNVQRIRIIGDGRNENRVTVCSILSPEDELKSYWGQINYEVHKSQIFAKRIDADKAAFIGKLS